MPSPTYTATWYALPALPQYRMSPGWRLLSETWVPAVDWLCETRGRSTLTERKAAWTSPEQSHELGPVPPDTYASPTWAWANATTAAAEPLALEEYEVVAAFVEPDEEEPVLFWSVVRAASREARSAASALALAAASAFFLASALRTASALAFLASLAALLAAASS